MDGIDLNDPAMKEIIDGFMVEARELLDSVSQDLMLIESNPDDNERINKIFRSFHTIKGNSSFIGFSRITEITHHAEDILNKIRRGDMKASQEIIDVLFDVHDIISELIGGDDPNDESVNINEAIDRIEQLKSKSAAASGSDKPNALSREDIKVKAVDLVLGNMDMVVRPGDFTEEEYQLLDSAFKEVSRQNYEEGLAEQVSDKINTEPSLLVDSEKQDVEVKEAEPATDNGEKEVPAEAFESDNISKQSIQQKETISQKQVTDTRAAKETRDIAPSVKSAEDKHSKDKNIIETIRIDVSRVESMMDLSGELVLGRNRIIQLSKQLGRKYKNDRDVRDLLEASAQIDFVTSEIQTAVMRMRMVPIGKLYQKAPRIVRDLSKEFKKSINLVVKGEETEIDRGIIEELNDPLVHMIRNSCDHGIEPPDYRTKVGKNPVGTIVLDADQEGNNIVLKISDDGKGLDPEKIKEKALEKDIVTQEEASQMNKREIYNLIFMPGFSTAAKISAVSGRGVGMDVVKTNIQNLKGIIEIDSELGKGTMFIIKLPLTLAIILGLLVKVENQTFAIPLSSVVEVVSINRSSVYYINQREVIRIREDVLPIISLAKALNMPINSKKADKRNVVVIGLGIERVGFVVDELLGQQEVVIKSLGGFLGNINGIAGSTILGDGRVIMIIDAAELIQKIRLKNQHR